MRKNFFFTLAASLMTLPASAAVVPANIFTDNAVLQRECPIPVWGYADANENVTVEFAGQKVSATADDGGYWRVYLEPMAASAQNRTMTVTGDDNKVEINNVLVGDVWLCSGQSNMQMPMWSDGPAWRAIDGDKHVAEGANPLIRISTIMLAWSNTPEKNSPVTWAPLDSENGKSFSATAFYFGQELYRNLNVPIGLINSSWGGTRIEPWTPPEGFASMPSLQDISRQVNAKLPGTEEHKEYTAQVSAEYSRWLADFQSAAAGNNPLPAPPAYPEELKPFDDYQDPTVIYNRMIYHMLPFAFKGVIWYQGCSNLWDGAVYQDKMQALLNGWRIVFEQPEMPFYFVQLAPFDYGNPEPLPVIWEAQEKFAEANGPEVAMAVINDVGDLMDIHPHDKLTVGKRLGALALKYTYGFDIKADSPILRDFRIKDDTMVLSFNHVEEWVEKGKCDDFQLAGYNGIFYPAEVQLNGAELIVSSPEVKQPVYLRYMWHGLAEGNLFNEAGYPLGAFRCGKEVTLQDVENLTTADAELIYEFDMKGGFVNGKPAAIQDNSSTFSGKFKNIVYVAELTGNSGEKSWAVISFDTFTDDITKIGVPGPDAGVIAQQKVSNLEFITNISNCASRFLPEGYIEFWSNNYNTNTSGNIPGGKGNYDFDDMPSDPVNGYGCMQIHDFAGNTTLFAYNNFSAAGNADIGIGNAAGEHPDWTFTGNGANYSQALLRVYVK